MATTNPVPVPVTNNRYTFKELDTTTGVLAGGTHIGQCGALLENRMRCPKTASFEVKDATTPTKPSYQVCRRHMAILEAEGSNYVAPVVKPATPAPVSAPAPTPVPPVAAAPKPVPQLVPPTPTTPIK
jgi:hypothetical protein